MTFEEYEAVQEKHEIRQKSIDITLRFRNRVGIVKIWEPYTTQNLIGTIFCRLRKIIVSYEGHITPSYQIGACFKEHSLLYKGKIGKIIEFQKTNMSSHIHQTASKLD